MYRANCLDGLSLSRLVDLRIFDSASVSKNGIVSLKTRTLVLSLSKVPLDKLFPIISLLIIATTFHFPSLATSAKCLAPYNPCSSPTTATKISVNGNSLWLIIRASSIIAATPEASSLAPGASDLASITSEARESKWPLIIKTRSSVGSVPFKVAITLPNWLSVAMRLPSALMVKKSITELNLPPDATAYLSNSDFTQRCAAPIPRVLLLVSLNVCRVPKDTSLRTVASMFSDFTSDTIFFISGSSTVVCA